MHRLIYRGDVVTFKMGRWQGVRRAATSPLYVGRCTYIRSEGFRIKFAMLAPFCLALFILPLVPLLCDAQRVTPLSTPPEWKRLEQFQETITHDEFVALLENVYAPNHEAWIKIASTEAAIAENPTSRFTLRFADTRETRRPVPRYWTRVTDLRRDDQRPLSDLKIALDPGHLGGQWAKLEERWFQIGCSTPVAEGDLTLRVAQLLALRLRELGAEVFLVRYRPGPLTTLRPAELKTQAIASLLDRGVVNMLPSYSGPADPKKELSIDWEAERLFYRIGEIHARARLINEQFKPDLTLCLHFNAEPWGDPSQPRLVKANHLHLLVNGSYSSAELAYDDERFAMLVRLLNQVYDEELGCAEAMARSVAAVTGLPPFSYTTPNTRRVGTSGFVWARNLLASRLYECPVIYIEPYVMNNEEVFQRIQAGEYDGLRNFGGVMRPNIYQEYVTGVVNGLAEYCRATRQK
jgi:N-acetylmuramoyl-L-alanine amidase